MYKFKYNVKSESIIISFTWPETTVKDKRHQNLHFFNTLHNIGPFIFRIIVNVYPT